MGAALRDCQAVSHRQRTRPVADARSARKSAGVWQPANSSPRLGRDRKSFWLSRSKWRSAGAGCQAPRARAGWRLPTWRRKTEASPFISSRRTAALTAQQRFEADKNLASLGFCSLNLIRWTDALRARYVSSLENRFGTRHRNPVVQRSRIPPRSRQAGPNSQRECDPSR